MKSIVHFRPDAENDVANAAAWYETQGAGLGAEFLDEFWQTAIASPRTHKFILMFIAELEEQLFKSFRLEFTTRLKAG